MSLQIENSVNVGAPSKAAQRKVRDQAKYWFGLVFATSTVLLLANSFYLYAAKSDSYFLSAMLWLHGWLGLILTLSMTGFAVPHYLHRRRHQNVKAKAFGYFLMALLVVACVLGIAVFFLGRNESPVWMIRGHELAFGLGLVLFLMHRLSAVQAPLWRYEIGGAAIAGALCWGLFLSEPKADGQRGLDLAGPQTKVASFTATLATTNSGHILDENDLSNPNYCAQCHQDLFDQWSGSAHRFSSMNDPFYERTFTVVQENRGPESMHFCGGCHDPLVLLTGNMEESMTRQTTNAQEGITCLACHSIVAVNDRRGNASYVMAKPDHYPFYESENPVERQLNLDMIRAKPEKHKRDFLKDIHRTSEFCLSCHKAHLDTFVNNYRWKRGQNDYDAWFDSSAGLNSALTFYNAQKVKSCQECHMPLVPSNDPAAKNGFVRDHTFPGSNSALPVWHNKPEWLEKTKALAKDTLKVDIFSAIDADQTDPESRIFPLERPDARLAPGSEVRVEVMVKNTGVGHLFPGGTMDMLEPWVEFIVADAERPEVPILASGLLSKDRRLDPSAHRYNAVLLSREGRLIDVHNVEHFFTDLYNNGIGLGQTDIVRYQFRIPEELDGKSLKFTARVRYRKFSQEYITYVFGDEPPVFPIIDYGSAEVTVRVGEPQPLSKIETVEVAKRLRDFSIGSLRQTDTKTALWGFQQVARVVPEEPDSYIDIARCYVQTGNFGEDLAEVIGKATDVNPKFPKIGFFLGKLLASQARFDEAAEAYQSTLSVFPDDRIVNNDKGLALFKGKRFNEAVETFLHTLEIDPENVFAHNYLSLSYQELGDKAKAEEHHEFFLRYQPQQAERSVIESYRRRNPHADREANILHFHPLHAPDEVERLVKENESYRHPHSEIQPDKAGPIKDRPTDIIKIY
jgi:tetratricopeptide (TPR) repeat protein